MVHSNCRRNRRAYTSLGARITATEKKKFIKSTKGINTYVYYHCTGRKKYIKCSEERVRLKDLETSVQKLIRENLINEKFYKLGLEVLSEMHEFEINKRQQIFETQQRNVEETQKKIDGILGYLINGTISESVYKAEKEKLENTLTKEKIKLNETEKRAKDWISLTEKRIKY